MKMNIGDIVEYYNVYDEKKCGKLVEISSDMDSYEDMKLEDGTPLYYSKKLSRFVPVKEKNMNTVFLTIHPVNMSANYEVDPDFVLFNEIEIKNP
jgi:flagellar assembly factor FliW